MIMFAAERTQHSCGLNSVEYDLKLYVLSIVLSADPLDDEGEDEDSEVGLLGVDVVSSKTESDRAGPSSSFVI
jgi:hypothetical protein